MTSGSELRSQLLCIAKIMKPKFPGTFMNNYRNAFTGHKNSGLDGTSDDIKRENKCGVGV